MPLVELLPDLHLLSFPVGNVYLWRGPDGVTLVDSGVPGSAPAIAAALDTLGCRRGDVRNLLLTHWHEDHVGSAAEVAAWGDVLVHAHRADAPVIRGDATGAPPVLADWERDLWDRVHAGMPAEPPAPVRVDRELDDDAEVDLGGGVRARAVSVPGHTAGSVAFHLPAAGVLFTGDTAARTPAGEVILGVFNADRARAVASLRRQADLGVEVACFGHGDPVTADAAAVLGRAADAAEQP